MWHFKSNPDAENIWYHLTDPTLVPAISIQGLRVNQPYHLTRAGSWAKEVYRCPHYIGNCQPIYLSKLPWYEVLSDPEDDLRELQLLKIELPTTASLVADLPSLIDTGAIISDDYEFLWWGSDEDDVPELLRDVHDEEWGIPVIDLVEPGYIARLAIKTTQTAACLTDIPADAIELIS